ncbi:dienelactone hydrolase family protein [Mycolicibacterium sp. 050158]|uniref:dienelactone hydrolase family protein n=1 Tax=Mycolicibacterium sp. 050158 TaxID=3090602 RepID=UPI00299EF4F9|nr:dienelactone hydrolase family protein [Mycolicibacterium sp. 050158]MDX1889429.1 dienelactone hydrolase family protein [Mycolicibacterium sp. 050158]
MPDVAFPAPAGPVSGYLSVPDGPGPWPGVVIVHDALGLTTDVKRIADRMAGAGYLTIVPALYHRGFRPRCVVATLRALSTGRGVAVDDVIAARQYLADDDRCTGKVGAVGFCMGGGFCLLLAPHGVFDAVAPNYGVLNHDSDYDLLGQACPVVASYGARDRMLRGAAAKVEAILTAGGVPHDVKEYPDVGHSFMNDFGLPAPLRKIEDVAGIAYSALEAEDAWDRIVTFFGQHLS